VAVMKVLIFGAGGFFGSAAALRFAESTYFDKLLLASRSIDKVCPLADKLGDKANAVEVDLHDEAQLMAAVESADIVANFTGPSTVTTLPIMRACAKARRPFCDVAAEASVFEAANLEQDIFSKAGVPLVIGAGFHPGVTDLFALTACQTLDGADSVDMFIVGNVPDYGDPDMIIEFINSGAYKSEGFTTIFSSIGVPASVIRDGRLVSLEAGASLNGHTTPDEIPVDFAAFASMEPLSISAAIPQVQNATIWYGLWPITAHDVLLNQAGAVARGEKSFSEPLKEILEISKLNEVTPPRIHFWAEAKGTKNDRPATARVYSPKAWASTSNMIDTTVGACVYTAEQICAGKVDHSGMATLPMLFEPKSIFNFLSDGEPELNVDVIYS